MKRIALAAALAAAFPAPGADSTSIDWAKVPARAITLFYPGQSSYEWLQKDHAGGKGAAAVKRGEACVKCHEGEEKAMGAAIVKGGRLEPTPVSGKAGSLELKVQAAYDAKNLYLRAQWKTQNPYGGTEHQYLRFDGKEWKTYGYPKLDKAVQEGQQPGLYEDRFTVMLDDGKVPNFARHGCWLTCHDGERDMPKQYTKEELAGSTLGTVFKKNDVRKYLPVSRSDPSDWRTARSLEEVARAKAEGQFVDLIQWRAHRSNPVGMADDGYVLEWRNFDAGKTMFAGNADAKTHQPKSMWDEKKVGYRSITAAELRKADHFLVSGVNAVAFDPNAGWKEGDMVPDYITQRVEGGAGAAPGSASASDNLASGAWKDGMWTVTIVRPLNLANPDDKALVEGRVYNVGFAVHDDNITTRGHHVSFTYRLGIGTDADIRAVKLP